MSSVALLSWLYLLREDELSPDVAAWLLSEYIWVKKWHRCNKVHFYSGRRGCG